MSKEEINVFIIGARGYTQNYGGWEALVHGLIDNWKDELVKFFVFEKVENKSDEGVLKLPQCTCIRICVEKTGSSAMMIFDSKCTDFAQKYIKDNHLSNPIMYYLGLRIGPKVWLKRRSLKKDGIILLENPAGLEWKRTKWSKLVQVYAYIAAHFMAHAVDYMICDAEEIRNVYNKMIRTKRPKKEFISYGSYPVERVTEPMPSSVKEFFDKWEMKKDNYYLILGRFIPENNYEMMFKGFINSDSSRDLVVVTNYKTEIQSFLKHIQESTGYEADKRVKMVGTVYDKELLHYIRQYAHGYIHGHSVGGTNPGLLEAMSETDMNLLYGCPFNYEVGGTAAEYFSNEKELTDLIQKIDKYSEDNIQEYGRRAKEKMQSEYSWEGIVEKYKELFHRIYNKGGNKAYESIDADKR